MNQFRLFALIAATACRVEARADDPPAASKLAPNEPALQIPALFGDGMVLQCDQPIPVWGWAPPQQKVVISLGASSVESITGPDGRWSARLAPQPASTTTRTLTIEAGARIEIRDVLVGEVWICGGQSNMEWPVGPRSPGGEGIRDWKREIEAANHPQIRFFDVKNVMAAKPLSDCQGSWQACSPETVGAFSAVGYFFGRAIHEQLKTPIGLISTNWGGTPAEAWTSAATIQRFAEFNDAMADLNEFGDDVAAAAARHRADMRPWVSKVDQADAGLAQGWSTDDFDDRAWDELPASGAWDRDDLKDFDGAVWLRKRFPLNANWDRVVADLELGPIDDMDRVFINGVLVGATELRGQTWEPRRYGVPEGLLKAGENVIAIRVIDIGGTGGLRGGDETRRLVRRPQAETPAVSLAGEWRYRTSLNLRDVGPPPRERGLSPNQPTALYNGMIAPLLPFGVRGAIWYQGESNRLRAKQYRALFPAMIEDWRRAWGQADFPFYFVQIAPYAYTGDHGEAACLREAQLLTLRNVPHVGMAVTMDIGDSRDIHPANKQDVGRRLALWALAKTYGKSELAFSGPLYRSMRVDADAIRISFDHAESGLQSSGGPLTCFAIAERDRVFVPADATIDGAELVVRAASVPQPVAVRFAWGAADQPNLQNAAGLPASSFRTDDWD